MRCYLNLQANCEVNYTAFGVFGDMPQFKETVEPSTLTH